MIAPNLCLFPVSRFAKNSFSEKGEIDKSLVLAKNTSEKPRCLALLRLVSRENRKKESPPDYFLAKNRPGLSAKVEIGK